MDAYETLTIDQKIPPWRAVFQDGDQELLNTNWIGASLEFRGKKIPMQLVVGSGLRVRRICSGSCWQNIRNL
jgi:hypothetical protein